MAKYNWQWQGTPENDYGVHGLVPRQLAPPARERTGDGRYRRGKGWFGIGIIRCGVIVEAEICHEPVGLI
jgi:hypothetical protein